MNDAAKILAKCTTPSRMNKSISDDGFVSCDPRSCERLRHLTRVSANVTASKAIRAVKAINILEDPIWEHPSICGMMSCVGVDAKDFLRDAAPTTIVAVPNKLKTIVMNRVLPHNAHTRIDIIASAIQMPAMNEYPTTLKNTVHWYCDTFDVIVCRYSLNERSTNAGYRANKYNTVPMPLGLLQTKASSSPNVVR